MGVGGRAKHGVRDSRWRVTTSLRPLPHRVPITHPSVRPPSTGSVAPVIWAASSESRKAMVAAISSGKASRPCGFALATSAQAERGKAPSLPSSFRVYPGYHDVHSRPRGGKLDREALRQGLERRLGGGGSREKLALAKAMRDEGGHHDHPAARRG